LDSSLKETKRFIKEFKERIKAARAYAEQVKKVQAQTNLKNKEMGGGTTRSTKQVRGDLSKYLVPGRKICYCQSTSHRLVNNCASCGKIVCEQEGEGPCLFCGSWVDREILQDLDEDLAPHYQKALEHRDRLIDYDVNAAKRLGVLDERSDWYELSNNTWLNKEQRTYATKMLEFQKKKEEEMDKLKTVSLDFAKGEATVEKTDTDFSNFDSQN